MQYIDKSHYKTIDDLETAIKGLTNIKTYAIITHDKDIKDNGSLKAPHFHAILTFSDTTTFGAIAKALHTEPQYINKIKSTTKTAQLYLVHRNNPEKAQYDPAAVRANFDYAQMCEGIAPMVRREHIAQKIATGEIKQYNLHQYISADEYARNALYYDRCFKYRQSTQKGVERNMQTIFVFGKSGQGKSTYATHVAIDKGYHYYIASGGKNPLDNYQGEECIILDDIRGMNWNYADLLKLTDPHIDSLVGCRYYNKSIAECKLLIITTIKSPMEFYRTLDKEIDDPAEQFYRRFPVAINVTKDTLTVYTYSPETGTYNKYGSTANPFKFLFNSAEQNKNLVDLLNLPDLTPEEKVEQVFEIKRGNFEELKDNDDIPF